METENGNWKWKLKVEMEVQSLSFCTPSKVDVLVFIPRHPRAFPPPVLIALLHVLLPPTVFLYWQILGVAMVGNEDIVLKV